MLGNSTMQQNFDTDDHITASAYYPLLGEAPFVTLTRANATPLSPQSLLLVAAHRSLPDRTPCDVLPQLLVWHE